MGTDQEDTLASCTKLIANICALRNRLFETLSADGPDAISIALGIVVHQPYRQFNFIILLY